MYILAIETTGKYGSAAVIDEAGIVCVSESGSEMNHLRDIISLCDDAMSRAGIGKKDINYIAASVGPGSFTGIRIGVTSARTIAQMLGLECIAVSSLEAMALRAAEAAEAAGCAYVCPIINARRHQTYGGVWKLGGAEAETDGMPELRPVYEQRQYMIEEICDLISGLDGRVMFTGDGVDEYEELIAERLDNYAAAKAELRYQSAGQVAQLALKAATQGRTVSFGLLLPEYMRLSEAEQRLRDGTLSKKIR